MRIIVSVAVAIILSVAPVLWVVLWVVWSSGNPTASEPISLVAWGVALLALSLGVGRFPLWRVKPSFDLVAPPRPTLRRVLVNPEPRTEP